MLLPSESQDTNISNPELSNDAILFREAARDIHILRKRIRKQKKRLKKQERNVNQNRHQEAINKDQARHAKATRQRIMNLSSELDERLKEIAGIANKAFSNARVLNKLLLGLHLPPEETPDAAVRALKRARIHINIYDVVSEKFAPIYPTEKALAKSVSVDGRYFPLELAKELALKYFLRRLRGRWR